MCMRNALHSLKHNFFNDGARLLFDCAGQGRIDVFFLSGGQIDGEGNVNLVSTGDYRHPKVRFPGSFGSAYLYYVVPKVILFRTEHSKRTMVEKLDFITAAGGMHGVVTPIAVFVKRDGHLTLQSWHPESSLDEVRSRTGFAFDADGATPTPLPTAREVQALRALDPEGQFERDAKVALR